MEFFKTMAEFLQDGQQLQMAIRKSGNNLAVSILPDNSGIKDKAVTNITPLVLSGLPDEFEEGFADALKPLGDAQGFAQTIKSFEQNLEKAKQESDMAKKLKDEAAKEKKAFTDLIALARKNNEAHKFKDARSILAKASALPSAEKSIVAKVEEEIRKSSGEGNMFGCEQDMSDGKDVKDVKIEQPKDEEESDDEDVESEDEE